MWEMEPTSAASDCGLLALAKPTRYAGPLFLARDVILRRYKVQYHNGHPPLLGSFWYRGHEKPTPV